MKLDRSRDVTRASCLKYNLLHNPPLYHGPPKPTCFMVNNVVFRWPKKTLIFHGFGGSWYTIMDNTLPETNMAPENGWLEDEAVSFWGPFAYFQVRTVSYVS